MANTDGIFQQGEPLDIALLNELVQTVKTNAASIQTISGVNNSIQGSVSKGLTVTDSGRVIIKLVNGVGSASIPSITLSATDSPMIFVSPSMTLTKKDAVVSVSVHGSFPNYTIYASATSQYTADVYVNWLAVGHRNFTA